MKKEIGSNKNIQKEKGIKGFGKSEVVNVDGITTY